MKTILVVDDEQTIRENIKLYLEDSNFKVIEAGDGELAVELFIQHKPDLVVLDLMLPKMMGEDVCEKIRGISNVPIIMLTAKSGEENIVSGLSVGADDYLVKPFSVKELVARVKSMLRRSDNFEGDSFVSFNDGDLKIEYSKRIVMKKDEECLLTKSEFEILEGLSKFSNKIFSREDLLEMILDNYESYDRVIDTHIKNLRKKIEDDTSKPKYIITVRGVGYKFGGSK